MFEIIARILVRSGRLFLYCQDHQGTRDKYEQNQYQRSVIHVITSLPRFRAEGSKTAAAVPYPNSIIALYCRNSKLFNKKEVREQLQLSDDLRPAAALAVLGHHDLAVDAVFQVWVSAIAFQLQVPL